MNKFKKLWLCSIVAIISCASLSRTLKVADFKSLESFNLIGGNFGAWDKDPQDTTQWAKNEIVKTEFQGREDYALKILYDVDSPNPAYNGFWMKLRNLDASNYKYLTFWIKGSAEDGFTNIIKIELKNATQKGETFVKGISDNWKEIKIPLKDFTGIANFKYLTEFVIVFADDFVSKKKGAIFIDEICFEK